MSCREQSKKVARSLRVQTGVPENAAVHRADDDESTDRTEYECDRCGMLLSRYMYRKGQGLCPACLAAGW